MMTIKRNLSLEVTATWSLSGTAHVLDVFVDGEPIECMSLALCRTTQGWTLRAAEESWDFFANGNLPVPIEEALHDLRGNKALSSFIADRVEERIHLLNNASLVLDYLTQEQEAHAITRNELSSAEEAGNLLVQAIERLVGQEIDKQSGDCPWTAALELARAYEEVPHA